MSDARLPPGAIAGLRGLARPRRSVAAVTERCDLCGATVPDEHAHMLDLDERRIICACETCKALKAGESSLRPVGSRTLWLEDFDLPDVLWAAFQIPIALAFFFRSSATGQIVGLYPSPAGATECELHLASWNALVLGNPVLATLENDVEALIVDRLSATPQYAIAPIDECYRMVGMIKSTWEGISGGNAVSNAVPEFMGRLKDKAEQAEAA